MLSVVLYGRNDSHGYNLHKRGALSLNCIAEVLTETDDELIFVDYNTPDELPTFPEAIADTLTEQCKARLRILRVRPSYHAQFAGRTRLAALECQSRNIAIRRSNPANRWVLSTNTDMIFCPADAGSSLSQVVAGLEDGFYHLPRFEVPEGFWERLGRSDPNAAIEAISEYGRRYHMNEVIYGSYDNIYEGPGDFQLFLRQDLFDIHGFDEQMIRGWHADSNIARRMKLFRGEVKTAFPQVFGYHCGHTRQATSLHAGIRIENNIGEFVRDLAEATVPSQIEDWGAPDADIEEVFLTAKDLYFPALAKAVPPEAPSVLEATYNLESYGKTAYDPSHVLPHLCDLVFNLRAGQRIAYIGNDVALLEGLRTFLEGAGKAPSFVLLDQGDAPAASTLSADRWGNARASFDEVMAEADLFIIQNPSADMEPVRERRRLELFCWWTLSAFAERELQRPFAKRRRVIVVNGIHNNLSAIVEPSLAPTTMPFSTRLRQGFVLDRDANRRWSTDGRALLRTTGEQARIDALELDADSRWTWDEQAILTGAIRGLVQGAPLPGWERLCAELLDIAQSPKLAEAFGLSEGDRDLLHREALDATEKGVARSVVPPEAVGPRAGIANRLCSPSDWRDADWSELGLRYYGVAPDAFLSQSRWTWERATLHYNLLKAVPPTKPTEPSRVLLITEVPDLLAPALVYSGYEVVYATVGELLGEEDSRPLWDKLIDFLPSCHSLLDLQEAGEVSPVRAILMTVPTFVERGGIEMDRVLDLLALLADDQTMFSSAFTVQLDAKAYSGVAFSLKEWEILFESNGALGSRGFTQLGLVDPTVPLDTALRFAVEDEEAGTIPGLSFSSPKGVFTIGAFTAQWPRLRHPGFNLPIMHMSDDDTALYQRLGRAYPFFGTDWQLLTAATQGLAKGEPVEGWERLATEIAAIVAIPGVRDSLGLDEAAAVAVTSLCDQAVKDAVALAAVEPAPMGPLADSLNRLCTGMDWEHGLWGQVLDRLFGSECRSLAEHKRWIWERTSLVYGLHKELELPRTRHVLMITPGPDPLANLISNLGFNVTCATPADVLGAGTGAADWQAVFEGAWLRTPGAQRAWADRDPAQRFDAVVCSQTVLLDREGDVDAMLAALAPLMAPGAQLHCVTAVQIDDGQLGGALTFGEWQGLYDEKGPMGARGFTALGGFNDAIPFDTLVRYTYKDDVQDTIPGLSFGYAPGAHLTVGVVSATWPAQLRPGPAERLTVPTKAEAAEAAVVEAAPEAAAKPDEPRRGFWRKR